MCLIRTSLAKYRHISQLRNVNFFETSIQQNCLKKTLSVIVGELVAFDPSMGFTVTAPGQKVTVYKGTVG